MLRRMKNLLVRDETRYRPILRGLSRGIVLPLNLSHQLRMLLGGNETPLARFVREYARPGVDCYDLGAGIGYYTFALARLCAPGEVVAIEADPQLCEQLAETARRNPALARGVRIVRGFAGAVVDPSAPAITLDHLVLEQGCPPPGLIKVDIEGAEADALAGATAVIERHHPRMIIEVHSEDLERRCREFLRARGYSIRTVSPSRIWRELRPAEHNRWIVGVYGASAR